MRAPRRRFPERGGAPYTRARPSPRQSPAPPMSIARSLAPLALLAGLALPARTLPGEKAEKPPERPAPDRARQLQQALEAIVAQTTLHAARAGIVVASL